MRSLADAARRCPTGWFAPSDLKDQSGVFNFDAGNYRDALVRKTYTMRSVLNFVREVDADLTPASEMADLHKSYEQYYRDKYTDGQRLEITNPRQNLLRVDMVDRRLFYHADRWNYDKCGLAGGNLAPNPDSRRQKHVQHLVPELCLLALAPASVYFGAFRLPTILNRVNELLLATELITSIRSELALSASVSAASLDHLFHTPSAHSCFLEDAGLQRAPGLMPSIVAATATQMQNGDSMSREIVEPVCACRVLQAFKTISSGDDFDHELLEAVGDSFLKYQSTLFLFSRYDEFLEDQLTVLRSQIISNANLLRTALITGVFRYVICSRFEVRSSRLAGWTPPLYVPTGSVFRPPPASASGAAELPAASADQSPAAPSSQTISSRDATSDVIAMDLQLNCSGANASHSLMIAAGSSSSLGQYLSLSLPPTPTLARRHVHAAAKRVHSPVPMPVADSNLNQKPREALGSPGSQAAALVDSLAVTVAVGTHSPSTVVAPVCTPAADAYVPPPPAAAAALSICCAPAPTTTSTGAPTDLNTGTGPEDVPASWARALCTVDARGELFYNRSVWMEVADKVSRTSYAVYQVLYYSFLVFDLH